MVIKGSARGRAGSLAAHLLRTDTNELAETRELRGVVSRDLEGALREMEAMTAEAESRRPFYHASINTRADELMTDEQKALAIDRLEAELGLTGQPRIVEEHRKVGREHLHIVWLRIDTNTMTAIPDSHNYRRHEIVARELEREFNHERVQGAHIERDGIERPRRTPRLAEMMQAERSGISPEQSRERLRELWGVADNGRSFAAALEDAGWTLAQGDKRGFVALDPMGEVRSVNKDITGLTAAKVRERLADIELDHLPSVDEARAQQRERQHQHEQDRAAERDAASRQPPKMTQTPALDREASITHQPEPVHEIGRDSVVFDRGEAEAVRVSEPTRQEPEAIHEPPQVQILRPDPADDRAAWAARLLEIDRAADRERQQEAARQEAAPAIPRQREPAHEPENEPQRQRGIFVRMADAVRGWFERERPTQTEASMVPVAEIERVKEPERQAEPVQRELVRPMLRGMPWAKELERQRQPEPEKQREPERQPEPVRQVEPLKRQTARQMLEAGEKRTERDRVERLFGSMTDAERKAWDRLEAQRLEKGREKEMELSRAEQIRAAMTPERRAVFDREQQRQRELRRELDGGRERGMDGPGY